MSSPESLLKRRRWFLAQLCNEYPRASRGPLIVAVLVALSLHVFPGGEVGKRALGWLAPPATILARSAGRSGPGDVSDRMDRMDGMETMAETERNGREHFQPRGVEELVAAQLEASGEEVLVPASAVAVPGAAFAWGAVRRRGKGRTLAGRAFLNGRISAFCTMVVQQPRRGERKQPGVKQSGTPGCRTKPKSPERATDGRGRFCRPFRACPFPRSRTGGSAARHPRLHSFAASRLQNRLRSGRLSAFFQRQMP